MNQTLLASNGQEAVDLADSSIVKDYLNQNSRFKVLELQELARGGEAVVYRVEH